MADEKSLNSDKSHIEWGGSYEKFKFTALKIDWGKKAFNLKKKKNSKNCMSKIAIFMC